jgi:hypothetical protein
MTTAAPGTENDAVDPDGLLGEPTAAPEGEPEQADEAPAELGDAGKKALDAMKAKWRAERDARKAAEDKLAAAARPKPDSEPPDLEALREQLRSEARAESLRDRVLDKIEARAAGKFKDPEDALLRLGKNVDDYIDDGKIDLDAIDEALEELLRKRPDFGVTQGEPKRFKGSGDGGPKGNAGKPQLTEADVKRLSKEGKHAEIEQARIEGRLNTLLGIT